MIRNTDVFHCVFCVKSQKISTILCTLSLVKFYITFVLTWHCESNPWALWLIFTVALVVRAGQTDLVYATLLSCFLDSI